jgi:signal peptidase I
METLAEHGTRGVSVGRSRAQRVARLLGALWCTALLWFLLVTVAPVVAGWRPMVVSSGSMTPAFRAGSVVLVAPSDPQHVALREIVVYERRGRMITHRVVGIRSDGTIQTQGDANDRPDSDPVRLTDVRGEVRFVVPGVGLPILWFHEGRIVPLALLALVTLLALAELPGPVPRRYRGAHFAVDDRAEARARLIGKVRMAGAIGVVGAIVAGLSVPPVEAAFTSTTTNDASTFSSAASFGIRYRGLIGTASCSSPTLTITVNTSVNVGRTIIVQVGLRESTGTVSVTDTALNQYSIDKDATNLAADSSSAKTRTVVLSAYVAAALQPGSTITVTVPSGAAQMAMASQFSGIAPTNRVDVLKPSDGSNSSVTASVTTTWSDTLLYGAYTNRDTRTATEATNFLTINHQAISAGTCTKAADNHGAYRVVSAAAPYSYDQALVGGNTDWSEVLVAYKAADNVAPAAPTLSGTAGDQETTLSWTTVTDISAPVTYTLYRDGAQVYSGSATTYNDTSLANDTAYAYTVKASDAYSNQSSASNEVDLTPLSNASIRYRSTIGSKICGGTASAITVPAPGVVAGRVVVVRVILREPTNNTAVSVSDPRNNTWTTDYDTDPGAAVTGKIRIVYLSSYLTSPLQTGDTITVTHPDSRVEAVVATELSGVAQNNRVGATNTRLANDGSPSLTLTTTTARTIIFATIGGDQSRTVSGQTAGWTAGTAWATGTAADTCGQAFVSDAARRIVSVADSYPYGVSLNNSANWKEAMIAYRAADDVAPSAPTLSGVNGDGEEFLSWTAVTDPSAPVTYQLYRDGVQIYTGTALKYDDLSRTNGVTYAYTVKATDSVGNQSVASAFNGKPVVGASPKFVKAIGVATCGTTSEVITVPAGGVAEGHTVVVRLTLHGASAGAVAATDSRGNTYSVDADAGAGDRVVILSGYVDTALQAGDTITVTHPSGGGGLAASAAAAEYSGIAQSGRFDASGSGAGSSTAPSASIVSTVAPRTLVYAAATVNGTVTYTDPPGWTPHAAQSVACGSNVMARGGYQKMYDAGPNVYTAALSGSKGWTVAMVAYKSAGEDVTGPPAPVLSGSPFHAKVSLSWTNVHDFSAPVTYHLKRDGVEIYSGSSLSYDDTGRTNGVTYSYMVYATDSLGNVGANSATQSITPVADTTAPAVPSGLAVLVGIGGNAVSWGSVTDLNGPVTYQLYRGATLVYSGTNLTYADAAGVVGSVYTVKASDSIPNQSAASSPVTATAGVVSSAVIGKQEGGTVGYLHQGGGYYVYANVSTGSQTITANVSNVTTGATSVSLVAGSYTAGGVSYNYRSALQTANATLAEGAKSFTVTPAGGSASNSSVTVDNTAPTAVDIQAANVTGGALGLMEAGDTITYTFSEPPSTTSILAGWDGSATTIGVSVADGGGVDSWTILATNGTTLPLGTVQCGDQVPGGGVIWVAAMVASGNTVTVTLNSIYSGGVKTSTKNANMAWAPNAALTDRAGNAMSTAVATESGTSDIDF